MTESRNPSLTAPEPQPGHTYPAVLDIPPAKSKLVIPEEAKRTWWERVRLDKIILFGVSLYLFILTIICLLIGVAYLGSKLVQRQDFLLVGD